MSLGPNMSKGPAFQKATDKNMANIEWMDESAAEVVNQLKNEKDRIFVVSRRETDRISSEYFYLLL